MTYTTIPGIYYKLPPVIFTACRNMNVSIEQVMGRSRKQDIVVVRQFAAHALHKIEGQTLTDAGKILGLTHATIINSCKQIQNDVDYVGLFGVVPERVRKIYHLIEKQ